MDIRAWGVAALVLVGGVGSPCGGEERNAALEPIAVTHAAHAAQVDQALLVAEQILVAEQWSDERGPTGRELSIQPFEPTAIDPGHRIRNPAGQLVLPAPQTSRAPAF